LLPLVSGLWQIRWLRRSGLLWRHGQSLAETIARDAGVRQRVEVLLHEAVPGPMTCGIVHPTIVLPQDADGWSEEDLNRTIVHELEHVRRGDSVSRCLARGACAAYWFHPLVWLAWRRLVLEAERSCDDAVLRRSEATAYADQLVGLAKRLSEAQRSPLLAMANRADLATRVGAVLDARQRRGPAGIFAMALACAAAVVLVIAMSPLRLVAAAQAAPAQTVTTPASPKPVDPNVQGESREKSNPRPLMAQSQPAPVNRTASAMPPAPKFKAASIKLCRGSERNFQGGRGPYPTVSPGRLNTGCVVLALTNSGARLIQRAYGRLRLGHIVPPGADLTILGGPAWIYSDSYVIDAEAEGSASEATMEGPMLQRSPSVCADCGPRRVQAAAVSAGKLRPDRPLEFAAAAPSAVPKEL
jgi:hypothetical protein